MTQVFTLIIPFIFSLQFISINGCQNIGMTVHTRDQFTPIDSGPSAQTTQGLTIGIRVKEFVDNYEPGGHQRSHDNQDTAANEAALAGLQTKLADQTMVKGFAPGPADEFHVNMVKGFTRTELFENSTQLQKSIKDDEENLAIITRTAEQETGLSAFASPQETNLLSSPSAIRWYKFAITARELTNRIDQNESRLTHNARLDSNFEKELIAETTQFGSKISSMAFQDIPGVINTLRTELRVHEEMGSRLTGKLEQFKQERDKLQREYTQVADPSRTKVGTALRSFLDSEKDPKLLKDKIAITEKDIQLYRQKFVGCGKTVLILDAQIRMAEQVIKSRASYVKEAEQIHDTLSIKFSAPSEQLSKTVQSIEQTIKDQAAQTHVQNKELTPQALKLVEDSEVPSTRFKKIHGSALQAELANQVCTVVNSAAEMSTNMPDCRAVIESVKITVQASADAMDAIHRGTPHHAVVATNFAQICLKITEGIADRVLQVGIGTARGVVGGVKDAVVADLNLIAHPIETATHVGRAIVELGSIILAVAQTDPRVSADTLIKTLNGITNQPLDKMVEGCASVMTSIICPSPALMVARLTKLGRIAKAVEKGIEVISESTSAEQKIAHAAQESGKLSVAIRKGATHLKPIADTAGNAIGKIDHLPVQCPTSKEFYHHVFNVAKSKRGNLVGGHMPRKQPGIVSEITNVNAQGVKEMILQKGKLISPPKTAGPDHWNQVDYMRHLQEAYENVVHKETRRENVLNIRGIDKSGITWEMFLELKDGIYQLTTGYPTL